ncbi:MAG: hypothetical protein JJ863_24775 [Deltaproteobacteria bacterium]|nr:hypothetical protein [Deltaproteobacteria bacterium]
MTIRIGILVGITALSASCEDDPGRFDIRDGGLEFVSVTLGSTGSFPCGVPEVNEGETPLVASSAGTFTHSVAFDAPEIVDGDLRAEVQIVSSGTSTRPMDTLFLLRGTDGIYRGSTTLAVPGASRFVVRTRVAGLEREDVGVFVSSQVHLELRAEPVAGTTRSFHAIATVTCTEAGTDPVVGASVSFTAGPDVSLTPATARTGASGEASVLATASDDGDVGLQASSGSGADSCIVSGRSCLE